SSVAGSLKEPAPPDHVTEVAVAPKVPFNKTGSPEHTTVFDPASTVGLWLITTVTVLLAAGQSPGGSSVTSMKFIVAPFCNSVGVGVYISLKDVPTMLDGFTIFLYHVCDVAAPPIAPF